MNNHKILNQTVEKIKKNKVQRKKKEIQNTRKSKPRKKKFQSP